jgi:hypothetical protein
VSFTLKGGDVVEYDKPFEIKDELIKKFNLVRGGEREGPWMWIHPDDVADYEADARDTNKVRLGVCCNQTLSGVSWGVVIPYKLQGADRPVCNMDELIDLTGTPQLCKEAFENSLPDLLEGEDPISKPTFDAFKAALGEDHEAIPKMEARLEKTDDDD